MEEDEYIDVPIGSYAVLNGSGTIACRGLGSCVAIMIYNRRSKLGGVAHAILPTRVTRASDAESKKENEETRYADDAIDFLLKKIGFRDATAKLVGGASMFGTDDIGERNIEMARRKLFEKKIRIVGEDVGGNRARSCFFNVETQEVKVRTSVRDGFSVKFVEKII